jgi:hypothetical protein
MGRTYSTNEGEEECIWGSQKERDCYEDQDINGWIILKWTLDS